MKIWIVSMECAGLIEAGGVKNVTYSLCEGFTKAGHEVTLFIPLFASTRLDNVVDFESDCLGTEISTCETNVYVSYAFAKFKSFNANIVFINNPSFLEKSGVYVYTKKEELMNPMHKCGTGHTDMLFLDTVLSKAVASFGTMMGKEYEPDIIHCQDAATAIIPSYVESFRPKFYEKTKCIVTIHNAGPAYHHEFRDSSEAYYYTELKYESLLAASNEERIEPFLLASIHGNLTTVSDFYAKELVDPKYNSITDNLSGIFCSRAVHIEGITNGIDYNRYDPENTDKSRLAYKIMVQSGNFEGKFKNRDFLVKLLKKDNSLSESETSRFLEDVQTSSKLAADSEKKSIYFVYHGRLVWQKGINIFLQASEILLEKYPEVKIIICGQGEQLIETAVEKFVNKYRERATFINGYNQALARLVVAASDFAVLPSHFEPCCLEDMIAQIYGTIPIAHSTGGLKKIIDKKTGFLYSPNTMEKLLEKMESAIKDYNEGKIAAMQEFSIQHVKLEYNWNRVIEKYLDFFKKL